MECKELKKQLANSGLPGKLLSNRCMCVLLRCYNVLAVMVITDSAKYFAFQFHNVHTFVYLQPPCGLWEYCVLDSFVDFGAVYIICLFTSYASPLILLLHVFLYFSTPLLIFSFENRPTPFSGRRS